MRIANLDWVRTPLLLEICKIPNQPQAEYRAYLDHEHVFQFPRCARSKQRCPAAVPNQNKCNWTWVGEWMAYQQYHRGDGLLETFPFSDAGGDPQRPSGVRHPQFIEHMSCDMVDHVQCKKNAKSSCPARLFIFENNEAVFRVIIQGHSPKLTHESRTHRVYLDCLFERTNNDSSISIRHVRTGEELADMLTEGAFTTVQWKSVMRLFDIHPQPQPSE